jgi:hypothetical protein
MQNMAKRQSKRTPEVEERIIEGLTDGVPLRVLCRQDDIPSWRTVYDWIKADPSFASRVAYARDLGFEAIAEDILNIADDTPAISEHVQRSKMRIDTRLKLLACWSPKRYGNKQDVSIGNKEGETLKIESNAENAALTLHLAEVLRDTDVPT